MKTIIEMLAAKLNDKNKAIMYKPDSILSVLEASNEREKILVELASAIADKVNKEVSYIRNTLVPLYLETVKKIDTLSAKYQSTPDYSNYRIVEYTEPVFLKDNNDAKFGGTRRAVQPVPKDLKQIVPPEDTNEMAGWFSHPISSMDSLVQASIAKIGVANLRALWEKTLSNSNSDFLIKMARDVMSYGDELVALYALCLNLEKNEKPVFVIASDAEYKLAVSFWTNEILNLITIYKANAKQYVNPNTLVLFIKDSTAYVNKIAYDKYLEEGFKPDSILGYSLLDANDRSLSTNLVESIKAHAAEYQIKWANFVKFQEADAAKRNLNKYYSIYSMVIIAIYDELLSEELKAQAALTSPEADKELAAFIKECNPDLTDHNQMALEIISLIYSNTNFGRFLKSMVEYGKLSNMGPDETVAFASLDYIVDYLLSQVYMQEMA